MSMTQRGINFETVLLQLCLEKKKDGESFSQTVNRLLKVAVGCSELQGNSLDASIIKMMLPVFIEKELEITDKNWAAKHEARVLELFKEL